MNVCDYLLKPFSFERFIKAVNKASEALNVREAKQVDLTYPEPKEPQLFVKVKGENKQYQVSEKDIFFVEASGNYSKIVFKDREITTLQKLSDIEEKISNEAFIRVHRTYVISRSKIDSIEGNQIDIYGHKIPIGQAYKEQIKRSLNL